LTTLYQFNEYLHVVSYCDRQMYYYNTNSTRLLTLNKQLMFYILMRITEVYNAHYRLEHITAILTFKWWSYDYDLFISLCCPYYVLHPVRLSVRQSIPCLRVSRNSKAMETYNLVET